MADFDPHSLLESRGLRATRPRVFVAQLLFSDGIDKHVTAESVAELLANRGQRVALATVYNTLNSFVGAGLMKQLSGIDLAATIFDTNIEPHFHFYDEADDTLTDIPVSAIKVESLPPTPDGKEMTGCDLIIRVR